MIKISPQEAIALQDNKISIVEIDTVTEDDIVCRSINFNIDIIPNLIKGLKILSEIYYKENNQ